MQLLFKVRCLLCEAESLTSFGCWHPVSGPTAVRSIPEAAVGQAGRRWEKTDRSCSDRGVVLQCWSPGCCALTQRDSQSTVWHNRLSLWLLCLALPLMWAELSLSLSLGLPLFLPLSLSLSLSLSVFLLTQSISQSLSQRRNGCSALSPHCNLWSVLPLHQNLRGVV